MLLVGDDRQRAAAGAGGVLRDIDAAHGCATLVEVMRFTDPAEGQASLALRAGDTSAVGFYADRSPAARRHRRHRRRHRLPGWAADVAAGRDSIMIAPTLDMVAELNARARADRIAAQPPRVTIGAGAGVANGERCPPGTPSITKTEQPDVVDSGRHRLRPEQPPVDRHRRSTRTGR